MGVHLDASFRSVVVWVGWKSGFAKGCQSEKDNVYISKGGRLMLIKSRLSGLLIYFMSLFSFLRKIRLRVENIQRDFIWGKKI